MVGGEPATKEKSSKPSMKEEHRRTPNKTLKAAAEGAGDQVPKLQLTQFE